MMPSPAATFQTASPARPPAVSRQMQRSCTETAAARLPPCKAWSPLVGVSRRRLPCRASTMQRQTSSGSERIVSGDNAVTVLPDEGRAAAVILVDAPADDQSAQSQQFGSPAASDAALLNSSARQRRREQRQRCAHGHSAADAGRIAPCPPPCQAPESPAGSETSEAAVCVGWEQTVYKMSAIAATSGIGSLAVAAVYYRFAMHMASTGGHFPIGEAAATLLLTLGGAIGMEMWARYAHKSLWHDFEPGWRLHKSHHVPRLGPFEDNDVFAIMNAVPAMGLCAYGFLTPNVIGGLCFGAGLGITLFGMSYMFIHDGLVHRRFPVGPIAEVPYLKRVAIAHKLHHSEKYDGVPWGLFLGPQELEHVGGGEELDRMVQEHDLLSAKRR